MQATSPGRRPVFSYTKMSAKPPCSTLAEQNFWAQPASSVALNREKEKPYLLKRRPKSSSAIGQSNYNAKIPRPKTSYVQKDKDICVKGDRYLQNPNLYNEQLIPQETVDNPRSSRCPTPDYMKDIYDQYSNNFCEHVLLRRPLYKSLPTVLALEKSDILPHDAKDKQQSYDNTSNATIQDETNTKTAETLAGIKNELKSKPETEKPKLAIDITLCDGKGCLMGMEAEVLESPNSVDEDLLSEHHHSCKEPDAIPEVVHESPRPKTGPGKTKRRSSRHKRAKNHQQTGKRRPVELHTVAVDYSDPSDDATSRTATSTQTENNKASKGGDEIMTQMAALGLAKPLDDDDLRMLMQQKAVPKFQSRRKARSGRPKSVNDIEQASKNRTRKIPIQIISDPFKCVGSHVPPSDPAPPARQALTARPLVRRPSSERRPRDCQTPSPKLTPKQLSFNSSKGSEDSLSSDVRLIRDKLLKVGVRLSGKKLQRCLQSPREKAQDDCVIRLRHMSSLSLLNEPKRWFEEEGD